MHESEEPIPAAAVAFVRDSPEGIAVYLNRRPDHFRYYPGAFVFPGGRRDPGDSNIRATAQREVLEEIGVQIEAARLVPLRDIHTSPHAGPVYHMITFAYEADDAFATSLNPEEIEEEIWIAAAGAVHSLNLPYQIQAAVHTISRFADVAQLMRALESGSINEDYWF
jgi:8-oxo-dGTP pyrophosphatase MutT (NUDIX family)